MIVALPSESSKGPNRFDDHSRIPALDGVRGLAILMVMAFHFTLPIRFRTTVESTILSIFHQGGVGVELFFVLSGFLITSILLNARMRSEKRILFNFYARRALRIFPLYFFAIIAVVVAGRLIPGLRTPGWHQCLNDQAWFWLYAVNIGQSLHGLDRFYYDWFDFTHFWTLAVEEHFYLIWPCVLLFSNRRGFVLICATVILVALAARTWGYCGATGWPYALTASLRQSGPLMFGSLLAIAINRPQSARWVVTVARPGLVVFGCLSFFLLYYPPARDFWPMKIFGSFVLGMAFAGLVALLVAGPERGTLNRLFEAKILRFFGKYSYALYVFHHLFFPIWLALLLEFYRVTGNYRLSALAMIATASTVSIGLSLLSWRLMEQPLLEYKKFFKGS